MRIYTKAGDLAFSTFTFPDGQPHFKLETYERDFTTATIETSIKSPLELFTVVLANDVLRQAGFVEVNLDIRYLLGARMDRAIDSMQPFTLQVVARMLNSCGFSKVRVLDVHSEVALRLIRNSENVLPHKVLDQVWTTVGGEDTVVVTPDKGAGPRVSALMRDWQYRYCWMEKVRKPETGELQGFGFVDGYNNVSGNNCFIIDDICDGGGTFVGIAKLLRQVGAKKVYLYVTHGIFSKGTTLEGIDAIYTTNSYQPDTYGYNKVVCIPISMKEL
jgi:ribose-phosphate pyrophosphokinase